MAPPRTSSDRRTGGPRREAERVLHYAELGLLQAALELDDRWTALVMDLPTPSTPAELGDALEDLLERLDPLCAAARAYRQAAVGIEVDR